MWNRDSLRVFRPWEPVGFVSTVASVGPIDVAGVEATDADASSVGRRRRVITGVIGIGLGIGTVAVVIAVTRRWWRGGGARRAVKELAEASAVALADVVVDELLPSPGP